MIDKVVLLTIFLYITLNLRKVDKFIQSGYKFESFTNEAKIDLETRMRIALVKSFGLIMFYYYMAPKTENSKFVLREYKDFFILIIFGIIFAVLITVLYFSDMLDLQWVAMLENVINELGSLLFIWVTITSTMAPSDKVLKEFKKILSDVQKVETDTNADSNNSAQHGAATEGGRVGEANKTAAEA
tara:strand:+ start:107 stop:664 length:558 start_codon:yes stop_codon:yes gene_type:complete